MSANLHCHVADAAEASARIRGSNLPLDVQEVVANMVNELPATGSVIVSCDYVATGTGFRLELAARSSAPLAAK